MLAHPVFGITGAIHERFQVGGYVGIAVVPLLGFVFVGPGKSHREEGTFIGRLLPDGSPDVSDADFVEWFLVSCHDVFSFLGC